MRTGGEARCGKTKELLRGTNAKLVESERARQGKAARKLPIKDMWRGIEDIAKMKMVMNYENR